MHTCLCSFAHVCTLTSLVDRSLPSSSTYSILTFGRYSLFSGKADSRSYRESSLQDISRHSCKVRAVAWHTSWPADPGDNTGKSEGRSFQTKCSTYILIPALSDSIRLHAKILAVSGTVWICTLYLSLSLSFCRSYSLWRKEKAFYEYAQWHL